MLIPVTKLPSNFKPYKFKSFKIRAINLQDAVDLGANPKLSEIQDLIQKLVDGDINAKELVPVDVKYILAMLSFHAFPKQTWTTELVCPYCKHKHKKSMTLADFPPISSLSDDDNYPLTIDDGKHVWEIGYASVEAMEKLEDALSGKEDSGPDTATQYTPEKVDFLSSYVLSVDGDRERVREELLKVEDFGLLDLMFQAIRKYFLFDDTYADFVCPNPECKKKYSVKMSAVEVTQYTPFLDTETAGGYKTNFRL